MSSCNEPLEKIDCSSDSQKNKNICKGKTSGIASPYNDVVNKDQVCSPGEKIRSICTSNKPNSARALKTVECSIDGLTKTESLCQIQECLPGFELINNSCVAGNYSCEGKIPSNATKCEVTNSLTSNGSISIVGSCPQPSIAKCEYSCRDGYELKNGSCQPIIYACTGTVPNNATKCSATNALTVDTANSIVNSCPEASSATCQYKCRDGFKASGNKCEKEILGRPFVSKWVTTNPNQTIRIPVGGPVRNTEGLEYDFVVDWGDGTSERFLGPRMVTNRHTYTNAGTYIVTISGKLPTLYSYGGDDILSLIEVIDLGDLGYKNLERAFYEAKNLVSFNGGITKDVVNMREMFRGTEKLKHLDLSEFNTGQVKDMSWMFYHASHLESINLSSFDTSKVVNMDDMFNGLENLENLNLSNFNTTNTVSMRRMFLGMKKLKTLNINSFNTSNVENMWKMFQGLESLETLNLSNFDTRNVTTMYGMFSGMFKLKSLNLNSFHTGNVTEMRDIFKGMNALESLKIDNFDTEKISDMSNMFNGLGNLTNLNLSKFNTSNVTNMQSMFFGMAKMENLDLSNFQTSKVTRMSNMFEGMNALKKLDISSFDTSNVIYMPNMFRNTFNLTSLNLNHFNTNNVETMAGMFWGSQIYNLKVENFNTTKVTNMSHMFYGASRIGLLDLRSFDTSNVTDMTSMFMRTRNTAINLNGWDVSGVTKSDNIFLQAGYPEIICDQGGSPGTGMMFDKFCQADNFMYFDN